MFIILCADQQHNMKPIKLIRRSINNNEYENLNKADDSLQRLQSICSNKFAIRRAPTLTFSSLPSSSYLNVDLLIFDLCKNILKPQHKINNK